MKISPTMCFVNLGTRGTLWIWEIFPLPIPYHFSRKIREIFKILWKRWKIMRLNEKIRLFLGHPLSPNQNQVVASLQCETTRLQSAIAEDEIGGGLQRRICLLLRL